MRRHQQRTKRPTHGPDKRRARRKRARRWSEADDLAAVHEHLAASYRGDAAAALAAYGRRPVGQGQPIMHELAFLDRLGEDAPDWLIARWACDTAHGWMLERSDPRPERAARALALTYEPPPPEATRDDIAFWLTMIAVRDDLVRQHALFDLGGLADFVDRGAQPELLARAPRLSEWGGRPWSVFERTDLRRDVLTVRDLATDESYDVLHLGAANGAAPDAVLLGRVAPTDAAPGRVFVHRPVTVDPRTADALVAAARDDDPTDGEAFAECLVEGIVNGRMPFAPGGRLRTWMWSDVLVVDEDHAAAGMVDGRTFSADDRVEDLNLALRALEQRHPTSDEPEKGEEAPRRTDLRRLGVDDEVATSVLTCECALMMADLNRDGSISGGLELAATNAANNLWYPPIVEGVREHATAPGSGPAWRAVAACLAEPFRSSCLEFAEVAERKTAA